MYDVRDAGEKEREREKGEVRLGCRSSHPACLSCRRSCRRRSRRCSRSRPCPTGKGSGACEEAEGQTGGRQSRAEGRESKAGEKNRSARILAIRVID